MQTAKTYSNIEGVVLAGGMNSRFGGRVKSLLPVGGVPIIEMILLQLESLFERSFIVTNYPDSFSAYNRYPMVADIFRGSGPLAGIHAAMSASTGDAVFIVAGDMPCFSAELAGLMLDRYLSSGPEALIPVSENGIEPLYGIYSTGLLDRLTEFLDMGASPAIRDFLEKVRVEEFPVSERSYFRNINTPSDLEEINRIIAAG